MEAIGSAASIIAVATLAAQVTKLCAVYVNDVRNASKDALALHRSLEATELLLKRLSLTMTRRPELLKFSLETLRFLQISDRDLKELKTRLEQHIPSRAQKRLSNLGWKSLKWPLTEALVQSQLERLDRFQKALDAAVQLDLVDINIGVNDMVNVTNRELETQRLNLNTMSTTLVAIETNVSHVTTEIGRVASAFDHGQKADLLRTLNHVPDAVFNASSRSREPYCTEGTRKSIIAQMLQWADQDQSVPIFWLSGMAGTGKSTIARTVASLLHEKGRLGGSFFFSRGRADLSHSRRLFASLAFQLAHKFETVGDEICTAINDQPMIGEQTVHEQYTKLFYQPLRRCSAVWPRTALPIIIIDALDECIEQEEIEALVVNYFGGATPLLGLPIKIIMTSRPEQYIHAAFRTLVQPTTLNISLHEIDSNVVQEDIQVYLKSEIDKIRIKRDFETDWPGPDTIKRLVTASDGLFIFAATICRFIHNSSRSYARALPSIVLSNHRIQKSTMDPIDGMYKLILEQCLREYSIEGEEIAAQRFRRVVGSLLVLQEELELSSLAELLFPESNHRIDMVLEVLHPLASVVRAVSGEPVRVLHKTLRDFLLDESRCPDHRFRINEAASHAVLTAQSMILMSRSLRRNMCGLPIPGTLLQDIEHHLIEHCILSSLSYACRFWFSHVQMSGQYLTLYSQIFSFLESHFLMWIEVLALLGSLPTALSTVRSLAGPPQSRTKGGEIHDIEQLTALAREYVNFLIANSIMILQAPLQVYYAGTLFSPQQSLTRQQFCKDAPSYLRVEKNDGDNWGAMRQTFVCEEFTAMHSIVFSSSSKFLAVLASVPGDTQTMPKRTFTLHLFDVEQGQRLLTEDFIASGTQNVPLVCFTDDESALLLADDAGLMRTWHTSTAELLCSSDHLVDQSRWKLICYYQPSPRSLMYQSHNTKEMSYVTVEGEPSRRFSRHSDNEILVLAYHATAGLCATVSSSSEVRCWNYLPSNESCHEFCFVKEGVNALAFSGDAHRLVAVTRDEVIVTEVPSGQKLISLPLQFYDHISSLVASRSLLLAVSFSGNWIAYCDEIEVCAIYFGNSEGAGELRMRYFPRSLRSRSISFGINSAEPLLIMDAYRNCVLYNCAPGSASSPVGAYDYNERDRRAFSSDGSLLAYAQGNAINICDGKLLAGTQYLGQDGGTSELILSTRGDRLAFIDSDGVVEVVSTKSDSYLPRYEFTAQPAVYYTSIQVPHIGRKQPIHLGSDLLAVHIDDGLDRLFSATYSLKVAVHDLRTSACIGQIDLASLMENNWPGDKNLFNHVVDVVFCDNSSLLLRTDWYELVRLFVIKLSIENGMRAECSEIAYQEFADLYAINLPRPGKPRAEQIYTFHDGNLVLVNERGRRMGLIQLDIKTWLWIREFQRFWTMSNIRFSPTGKHFACHDRAWCEISLFETITGKLLFRSDLQFAMGPDSEFAFVNPLNFNPISGALELLLECDGIPCQHLDISAQKQTTECSTSITAASDSRETPTVTQSIMYLDNSASWIMINGQRHLWLPPDKRPRQMTFYRNSQPVIVIGNRMYISTISGRLLIIRLDPEKLALEQVELSLRPALELSDE